MKKPSIYLILLCFFILIIGNLRVIAVNFSPNDLFFVSSVAYKDLLWDFRGFHFRAETVNGILSLWPQDYGADRFIKIIPFYDTGYFCFQPQHTINRFGESRTEGGFVTLKVPPNYDFFNIIEVPGERNTYYIQQIQSSENNYYMTAHGKGEFVTMEKFQGTDQQKWYIQKADPSKMAPPPTDMVYAIENGTPHRKFIDIPGAAPNQGKKGAKLQLWSMDNQPDRFIELISAGDNYFYFHPLHSTEVWDVQGAKKTAGTDIQLWPLNHGTHQQFMFEYAGEPLTYFIKDRNSGLYVDASLSNVLKDGCPIRIYPKYTGGSQDHQKWRLHPYEKWQMPPEDQTFYIKSAYINKYWDIRGKGPETNELGKNFIMWDFDEEPDRKYRIIPSGNASWVNIQVQNGGRYVDIKDSSTQSFANLVLANPNGSNSQRFAIQFTSPTTFVIRTNNWKAVDIRGGTSDDWKKNGAELIQYDAHFLQNQQFRLVYADGPRKGQTYSFTKFEWIRPVSFTEIDLTKQQLDESIRNRINFFDQRSRDYRYGLVNDLDGQIILAIYGSAQQEKGNKIKVAKVEERDGGIVVYLEEYFDSKQPTVIRPTTYVKLHTKNNQVFVFCNNIRFQDVRNLY